MISDVAIIGAGVVGCALARRLALDGAKVMLIEAGTDILSGASKANSAILHTGFDAPAGSLELQCVKAGYAEYLEIHGRMGLPLLRSGAIVVAWNEHEEEALLGIRDAAAANGIHDTEIITAARLSEREPRLARSARAGVVVAGEFLIDPWSPSLAYVEQAISRGATIRLATQVTGGEFDGEGWTLFTSSGRIRSRHVINCAGNQGDIIDRALLGDAAFEIRPRKGQFVVFDKAAYKLVSSIILPVPNERTKGVVVTRTIFGNLLVGPTAEEQTDRDRAELGEEQLRMLIAKGREIIPDLANIPVTACYAGLRPATDKKEYRILPRASRNWITVGGIRSTGLTAALGIAQHVSALYRDMDGRRQAIETMAEPVMPNLAEHLPRDFAQGGYGEIICHCEMVTRREIEVALSRPLPASDFGGLRRRTRCAMGRCQGFNCSSRLAEMTRGRFAAPLDVAGAK